MSAPAKARALFPFVGAQVGDLSFAEDEVITVLKQNTNGWWVGTIDGRKGEFPFNYVEIMSKAEIEEYMKQQILGKMNAGQPKVVKKVYNEIVCDPVPKSFQVTVTLAGNGMRVLKGQFPVVQFRTLDTKLRQVIPGFDGTLPPIWFDNTYFTEAANKRRCIVLTMYLRKLIGSDVAMKAVVDWLKNGASGSVPNLDQALSNPPALARVEFNWEPHDAVELQLVKGECIAVLSRQTLSPGWWEGQTIEGQRGLFPYNHVKLLNASEASAMVQGKSVGKTVALPPKKVQPAAVASKRALKKEKMFALGSMDSFDALLVDGFTMEQNGRLVSDNVSNAPGAGDRVVMSYVGYVWDCQKQEIAEFAASDRPDNQGQLRKLEFVMEKGEVIKGIELAAGFMEKGQSVRLIVKPELAYGDVGFPQLKIPPNVHLVYDITLEDFSSALPGPPGGAQEVDYTNYNAPIVNRQGRGHGNDVRGPNRDKKPHLAPVAASNKPPAPKIKKPPVAQQQAVQYDLHKMREIVRTKTFQEHGVQAAFIEENLTDAAFQEAFHCDRSAFILKPRWKQMRMKKDARLF